MEERYAVELRERDPTTVDTLFLDNSEGGEIRGISDKLTNLTVSPLQLVSARNYFYFPDAQYGKMWSYDSFWASKFTSTHLSRSQR